jgi:hypothetical protein
MATNQPEIVNIHLPAIGIINSMRSGGNMLNRLFDSHPQLLTNHSETFFGVFQVHQKNQSINLEDRTETMIKSLKLFMKK